MASGKCPIGWESGMGPILDIHNVPGFLPITIQLQLRSPSHTTRRLIVHFRFDFRILLREVMQNGLLERYPIPEGVYVLDTYPTFLDLEKEYHMSVAEFLNQVDWPKGVVEWLVSRHTALL